MTIKDMEARSGMSRANIRFYESEGLLSPARSQNGYRDYSEEDLSIVKRIKLLRSLHVPLEEIKQAQSGAVSLQTLLANQLRRLESQQEDLQHSQEICRRMLGDSVRFETLNAGKYLDDLESRGAPVPELAADKAPRAWIPWRRFFARRLDEVLYSVGYHLFLLFVFHMNLADNSNPLVLTAGVVSLLLNLLIEPLLLSRFRTTLGKWVFGIRVTDNVGGRLSYRQALGRTLSALWYGEGFTIPIFSLIRLCISYRQYSREETLRWEYDSEETVRDTKNWRCILAAVLFAFLSFSYVSALNRAEFPPHRGELTVEQFDENRNYYLKYYSGFSVPVESYLEVDGQFHAIVQHGPGSFSLTDDAPVTYSYREENGVITEVRMEYSAVEANSLLSAKTYEKELALRAFLLAQPEADWGRSGLEEILKRLQDDPFTDFSASAYGVDVHSEFTYSGCEPLYGLGCLSPNEGELAEVSMVFTMKKAS